MPDWNQQTIVGWNGDIMVNLKEYDKYLHSRDLIQERMMFQGLVDQIVHAIKKAGQND